MLLLIQVMTFLESVVFQLVRVVAFITILLLRALLYRQPFRLGLAILLLAGVLAHCQMMVLLVPVLLLPLVENLV